MFVQGLILNGRQYIGLGVKHRKRLRGSEMGIDLALEFFELMDGESYFHDNLLCV